MAPRRGGTLRFSVPVQHVRALIQRLCLTKERDGMDSQTPGSPLLTPAGKYPTIFGYREASGSQEGKLAVGGPLCGFCPIILTIGCPLSHCPPAQSTISSGTGLTAVPRPHQATSWLHGWTLPRLASFSSSCSAIYLGPYSMTWLRSFPFSLATTTHACTQTPYPWRRTIIC